MSLYILYFPAQSGWYSPISVTPTQELYMHISAFWHLRDWSLPPNKKPRSAGKKTSIFEVPWSIDRKGDPLKNYQPTQHHPLCSFFQTKKGSPLYPGAEPSISVGNFFSSQGKLSACFPLSDLLDAGKSSTNPRVGIRTQAPKKKVDKKGPFFDKKDEYDMICW